MKIEILGPGCSRCDITEQVVINVLAELQIPAEVIKVSDLDKMLEYNITSTPALIIDGEIKMQGRIPSKEEIKNLLKK